jgi:acyl-CoA synthetase (NDP forming)
VSAPASDLTPDNLHDALSHYGIRLPRTEHVDSAEAAAQAAARIGFPVVLKIRSPDILHKTEASGVALDLRSESGVLEAAERMKARALDVSPGARIEGFDVQEMVAGGVEAIVGARDDALYGPMLLVGSGGVLVEWLADVSLAMLPLERPQLAGMLDKLKVATLLAGYRGRPAADRAALEEVALALGRFFLDHRERIADIEINPVAVKQAGDGAIALDVRVLWR